MSIVCVNIRIGGRAKSLFLPFCLFFNIFEKAFSNFGRHTIYSYIVFWCTFFPCMDQSTNLPLLLMLKSKVNIYMVWGKLDWKYTYNKKCNIKLFMFLLSTT